MRRMQRIVLLTTILAVMPVLAGCSSFDPDSLDIFGWGEKKKLPGDRRPVFPEGVPGVTQGVPPQLIKGNQAQIQPDAGIAPDAAPPAVAAAPVEEAPKAAPKPRAAAKRTAAARPKPVRAAPVQPVSQEPQQAQPAWPQPQAQPQAEAPASGSSTAWPAPPPPGTFSR